MFWQQQQNVCNNLLPWYKWHDYIRFKFQIGKLLTIVTPRAGYTQNCTIAYRGLLYYFINNRLWLKYVYVFIINHYYFTPYIAIIYAKFYITRRCGERAHSSSPYEKGCLFDFKKKKKKKNSLRNRGPAARSHIWSRSTINYAFCALWVHHVSGHLIWTRAKIAHVRELKFIQIWRLFLI